MKKEQITTKFNFRFLFSLACYLALVQKDPFYIWKYINCVQIYTYIFMSWRTKYRHWLSICMLVAILVWCNFNIQKLLCKFVSMCRNNFAYTHGKRAHEKEGRIESMEYRMTSAIRISLKKFFNLVLRFAHNCLWSTNCFILFYFHLFWWILLETRHWMQCTNMR